MINNVSLVGRAVADPDMKSFAKNGNTESVAKIRIAVNRPTRDKQADFFIIEAFGKQAEVAQNYIKKGNLFGAEGRLKLESWKAKDGTERSQVIVSASRLILMPNGKQEAAASNEDPFSWE